MLRILKIINKISSRIGKHLFTYLVKKKAGSVNGKLTVNKYSHVGKNVILGNNVNFNGMYISPGGTVKIGDNFHSGRNCQIIVQYHNYDKGESIPYDKTYINKNVTIKDNVWLGNNVIILGGVTIGEGAIIQAGSVVVKDIEDYAIAGGNPAKIFKYRNKEHYEKLKQQGKFH